MNELTPIKCPGCGSREILPRRKNGYILWYCNSYRDEKGHSTVSKLCLSQQLLTMTLRAVTAEEAEARQTKAWLEKFAVQDRNMRKIYAEGKAEKYKRKDKISTTSHVEKCPVCEGSGKVAAPWIQSSTGEQPRSEICHGCRGKGWVVVPNKVEQPSIEFQELIDFSTITSRSKNYE